MLQQIMKVGNTLLVASANLYAMERPSLKDIAIKKVAELITQNPGYCVKVFNTLPCDLSTAAMQQLMITNKYKSALPIIILGYKHYLQQ